MNLLERYGYGYENKEKSVSQIEITVGMGKYARKPLDFYDSSGGHAAL